MKSNSMRTIEVTDLRGLSVEEMVVEPVPRLPRVYLSVLPCQLFQKVNLCYKLST